MPSTIGSVIIASTQSVAKVFLIGAVGYLAVLYPRKAPFLPQNLVGQVARFTFHTLTIPLIYSTIAIAVSVESVGNYWFVFVGAFVVIGISYAVAASTSCLIHKTTSAQDYRALKLAAAYPNIVALPILIFPSLCEYPVVYEGYITDAPEGVDAAYLQRQCVAQSNAMIFCYFFSWSLAFWSFGHRQLMQAATDRHRESTANNTENNDQVTLEEKTATGTDEFCVPGLRRIESESAVVDDDENDVSVPARQRSGNSMDTGLTDQPQVSQDEVISSTDEQARGEPPAGLLATLWNAFIQTIASPGFMAMAAGFLTACIPPLQKALFEGGGPLRFLGSAVETLGMASSPLSTMVVAASLVQPRRHGDEDIERATIQTNADAGAFQVIDENPGMTDPNFGPYRRRQRQRISRFQSLRSSVTRASVGMLKAVPRTSQEMFRLHFWFCASRLVLTPAVTVGIILALDCSGGGLLDGVPNLAKLVIIVNSALPGALLVIVLLQFDERMAETASVVAKVYMPSYLLSIFTIAAWTAVALWITVPDQDGLTMCRR